MLCNPRLTKYTVLLLECNHSFCYPETTKKEVLIMDISEKILKLRKANNLTQEQLAEQLQVSRQAVLTHFVEHIAEQCHKCPCRLQ